MRSSLIGLLVLKGSICTDVILLLNLRVLSDYTAEATISVSVTIALLLYPIGFLKQRKYPTYKFLRVGCDTHYVCRSITSH